MKIRRLELQDFQAHHLFKVELSPSITTIKGPTDVGKSSILRAVRWACQNDLAGDEFIRDGAKKTIVSLTVRDGGGNELTLRRIKSIASTGINLYELEGKEFKSFSVGVPADIKNLLQLNEINFQAQHDSPFWFNETAGEVSRRLNAVIDLSIIDTTLSNISSAVRAAHERVGVSEERREEVKKELEELEPKRARVEDFNLMKGKYDKLMEVQGEAAELIALIQTIRSSRETVQRCEERSDEGRLILPTGKEALRLNDRCDGLGLLLATIEVHEEKVAQAPPDFKPVDEAYERWAHLSDEAGNLKEHIAQIGRRQTLLDNKVKAMKDAEEAFHKGTKGQRCPLCQQIIK